MFVVSEVVGHFEDGLSLRDMAIKAVLLAGQYQRQNPGGMGQVVVRFEYRGIALLATSTSKPGEITQDYERQLRKNPEYGRDSVGFGSK